MDAEEMNVQAKRVHIVYATDDGYLLPTLVAISSAVRCASIPERLQFHVLDTGISDEGRTWFDRFVSSKLRGISIQLHFVDIAKYKNFRAWHGSYGTYARLDIPKILADVDWCVYADGDTLFTDDPLKLREVFDSRYLLQAHEDWREGMPDVSPQEIWFKEHNYAWDAACYFCAGFCLMNLKQMRIENISEKCFSFIHENPSVLYLDQDALYYTCYGRIGMLPDEWGRFSWSAFHDEKRGCLHFASDLPWKLMTNLYMDYNDAHKAWFDCAREMLGLEMRQCLFPAGFNWWVFARKCFFRKLFKVCSFLVKNKIIKVPGRIEKYCQNHYE